MLECLKEAEGVTEAKGRERRRSKRDWTMTV